MMQEPKAVYQKNNTSFIETMNTKLRFFISILFVIWLTALLAVFFIVQKPAWASVISGISNLFATIALWILFVCAAVGIGYFIFDKLLKLNFTGLDQRVIFSAGLGMGLLGLLGFLLALAGLANKWLMLIILVIIFLITGYKYKKDALQDLHITFTFLIRSTKYAPRWIPFFSIILLSLSFILSLAPPLEAFDGLFYHLTVPDWWIRDGGIELVNMPHYWFPSLLEGMFVWSLALDLDSTPQLLHGTLALLSLSLIFGWTQKLFGSRAAWWSIAVSISMPSLPWLAAWAYTDLGLTFYSIGTLFAITNWMKDSSNSRWLIITGLFCGFAVGIKYTAFILPILCVVILFWKTKYDTKKITENLAKFTGWALLSGGVWYLRNFIWTGNPFYPFVFGGPFWDSFRADWYARTGSGIGFDLAELLLLPFVTTLGYRDENFFDGRIGPFYLFLFPVLLFTVWRIYKKDLLKQIIDVKVLFAFGIISIAFWVFGVIQTSHLMQARLLLPALIALLPLFGKSILQLETLNTPKFRFQFVLSTAMALTTFVFILDFGLLVFSRNPIMVAIGSESRVSYTERLNSTYAQLISLAHKTPPEAYIYFINEPRSYKIDRLVQPDPINDNLAHDFYLYSTNIEVTALWKQIGYTHVLTRETISDENNENQHLPSRLDELRQMLVEIDRTEEYILYQIP